MKIDDTTILQYVEHELPNHEIQIFESIMANDLELEQKVLAVRASQLPYQAAFSAENLAEPPEQLREQIKQLTGVAAYTPKPYTEKRTWLMVASIIFALISGPLAVQGVKELGRTNELRQWYVYGRKPLIDAMIQYQALYIRSTVENVNQTMSEAMHVVDGFNQATSRNLSIPRFDDLDYSFRRAQELAFENQSIIQMVYLSDKGKPIALCATKSEGMEAQVKVYQYAGMNSLIWVRDGIAYMLMGDYPVTDLMKLAENA